MSTQNIASLQGILSIFIIIHEGQITQQPKTTGKTTNFSLDKRTAAYLVQKFPAFPEI